MQYHNLSELKLLIASKMTPEELLDFLDIDMLELTELLEDKIVDLQDELEIALQQ